MRFCTHCGKEINEEAVVCIHCGCATQNARSYNTPMQTKDKANAGLVILCVLFPIVGLILWAVTRDETPQAASTYGKAALISFGVCLFACFALFGLLFNIILTAF